MAWRWFGRDRPSATPPDGFGQTLAEDLRFLARFRRCRRRATSWREPSAEERRGHDAHRVLGRFGDYSIATATMDGELWLVRERDWHGWPDPPRYAFFALAGDDIRVAADFDYRPIAWTPRPR